jgi:hypothetical protein
MLNVEQGGAIYVRAGSISIYNSMITDSAAQNGSAIYVNEDSDSATVNLVNVTVVNNVGLSDSADAGAAIYSENGVVNLWNTIVALNTLSNGTQAQDVYKGSVNSMTDTVVDRSTTTLAVPEYASDALTLANGQTVTYSNQTLTYYDGVFYFNYGQPSQSEATFYEGATITVPVSKTLTYRGDGWYLGGVVYDLSDRSGSTATWTNAATGETETVYYRGGSYRQGSYFGPVVTFSTGDTLTTDVNVNYAYNSENAAFYRINVTQSGWGWLNREYTMSQEAQVEYAQRVLTLLQQQLAFQTTYTKTINGVEVSYPISEKSVVISGLSADVSRGEEAYSADLTYTATYTFVTQMGVTVLHTIIGLSDSVAAMTSGNGSYIGSADNDLSGVIDALFTDAENGDYTLTNNSLATNAGDNSYFNQGTFNGTYDSLDIQGNRRIFYTTVDMGAFENQTAKDSPVTSVTGLTVNMTVTTQDDVVDPTDAVTSLREALSLADTLYERGYQNIVINVASPFDVHVDAGKGSLAVNAPVTINGNGATIDCDLSGCGLTVSTDGSVVISNLIIVDGISGNGGGIKVTDGDLTLSN